MGLVQITPSPWNKRGVILVLTGTTPQGLEWAWNAILDAQLKKQFSGNIMVVGPEKETSANAESPTNIHFQQTSIVVNIPVIGKFLQQHGQSDQVISLVAIALVGLFTLIALKVAPLIFRLEIKLKSHSDPSEKEQE
jgi:hypothetical protein